jgi:hypothetical protein
MAGQIRLLPLAGMLVLLAACQPTVRVEAPEKPIVINVNVKIEHEVRVRVEKDIEDLLAEEPELF